ncbi:small ribosomal subunit protein eS10A [Trichomonascus vanleenenianus]|uniref:eS10 family ribosomal protein n=1 Tax=Trichomonascus vanleenenianus TaxID=2268995 RepID=UPI003EC99157
MFIPKDERKKIHTYLFKEGVVVAKKDFNQPKHEEIDTKNLFVIKALQSLNSRGYVKTQFSWQYYYYTLTDAGVEYLREWLHLPTEIVPATHKKQVRQPLPGARPSRDGRGPRNFDDGYRRRAADKEAAPGEYKPQFNQ